MKTINVTLITSFILFFNFAVHPNNDSSVSKNIMSDTYLRLIPIRPDFIPDKTRQGKAKTFLNSIFKNKEIKFDETKDIEFVDQGANFESVSCNYCGRIIDNEFWQDAMDKAQAKHFRDLTLVTPCCHKTTSLNDLKYQRPAGFAKFTISISNPADDIKADALSELEKLLGIKIRKIWAHY